MLYSWGFARTSNSPDHLPIDINLFGSADSDIDHIFDYDAPSELTKFDFEINRKSRDVTVNKLGRNLLEICKANNILILNGRSFNDKAGNFTCNDASVVLVLVFFTNEMQLNVKKIQKLKV